MKRLLFTGFLIGTVAWLLLNLGCGASPVLPSAPTSISSTQVVPDPPVTPPVTMVEQFCPYPGLSDFKATEVRFGTFAFSWDVQKSPEGDYLKRYQIRILRNGTEFAFAEADIKRLSGPKDVRAIHEWKFPGTDPGSISAQARVHYPDACRDEGTGQVRANGPWSPLTPSTN